MSHHQFNFQPPPLGAGGEMASSPDSRPRSSSQASGAHQGGSYAGEYHHGPAYQHLQDASTPLSPTNLSSGLAEHQPDHGAYQPHGFNSSIWVSGADSNPIPQHMPTSHDHSYSAGVSPGSSSTAGPPPTTTTHAQQHPSQRLAAARAQGIYPDDHESGLGHVQRMRAYSDDSTVNVRNTRPMTAPGSVSAPYFFGGEYSPDSRNFPASSTSFYPNSLAFDWASASASNGVSHPQPVSAFQQQVDLGSVNAGAGPSSNLTTADSYRSRGFSLPELPNLHDVQDAFGDPAMFSSPSKLDKINEEPSDAGAFQHQPPPLSMDHGLASMPPVDPPSVLQPVPGATLNGGIARPQAVAPAGGAGLPPAFAAAMAVRPGSLVGSRPGTGGSASGVPIPATQLPNGQFVPASAAGSVNFAFAPPGLTPGWAMSADGAAVGGGMPPSSSSDTQQRPQSKQEEKRRPSTSGSAKGGSKGKTYNFVNQGTTQKRPRRRYDEIERLYSCDYPGCTKGYGTLNHLNSHKVMQKHGPKSTPAQFKELRKAWRANKKAQAAQQATQRPATSSGAERSSANNHTPSSGAPAARRASAPYLSGQPLSQQVAAPTVLAPGQLYDDGMGSAAGRPLTAPSHLNNPPMFGYGAAPYAAGPGLMPDASQGFVDAILPGPGRRASLPVSMLGGTYDTYAPPPSMMDEQGFSSSLMPPPPGVSRSLDAGHELQN